MSSFLLFFFVFYILLISVIGYGILFQRLCYEKKKITLNNDEIFLGFYGLFFLTFISIITSLFIPHNFLHNIILHTIGILIFFFSKFDNKKKYFKIILLISFFSFSALLISKTHDDFSYYHLTFTKYLTEHKVIFGMSNLGHGYKLLSSLFFLNSTFYLPFIEYFSFHFSLLFFIIFFNFFLFKEIISKDNSDIIKFICLLALAYFNLSFNRFAEFGTDKAGQLLIIVLIIKAFQISCFNKDKNQINNFIFLIPLLGFSISLKTYFIPYILLGVLIFLFKESFLKNLKIIFFSKSSLILIITLAIYSLHHFISTGCIISPISSTCFGDNLYWADNKMSYKSLALWLEQWAKAGAGPDFRVEDPKIYIQNFNWLSHWTEKYFVGKFKEQLFVLATVFFIVFLLFKKFELKNRISFFDKKILIFYFIIIFIFIIWFTKHPTLRYGGYPIVFLILAIPAVLLIKNFKNRDNFEKKFTFFVILIIIIFNFKNINRIQKELKRNDLYKYTNFPFYSIPEKEFFKESFPSGLIIYRTKGHCWNTPTPCIGNLSSKIFVNKLKGYYFIYK